MKKSLPEMKTELGQSMRIALDHYDEIISVMREAVDILTVVNKLDKYGRLYPEIIRVPCTFCKAEAGQMCKHVGFLRTIESHVCREGLFRNWYGDKLFERTEYTSYDMVKWAADYELNKPLSYKFPTFARWGKAIKERISNGSISTDSTDKPA